jgi:hypothetical protein
MRSLYAENITRLCAQYATEAYSLTLDTWTSPANEAYLGATIHYINEEWKMTVGYLGLRCLGDSLMGERIQATLKEMLPECRPVCVTTDGGSNVVRATKELLKYPHVPCAAHLLQLVIDAAIKDAAVTDLLAHAHHVVTFFHAKSCEELSSVIRYERD